MQDDVLALNWSYVLSIFVSGKPHFNAALFSDLSENTQDTVQGPSTPGPAALWNHR